jgi:drug/metabolite transporter (DMT)-like permease
MNKITFTALTALRFAVALPVLSFVLFLSPDDSMLSAVSFGDMGAVVLLAFVPGLVALLLYYQGLRSTPASAATLAELAFPLSAVGLNYLVFDTVLTGTQWVGVVMLAATITTMTWLTQRGRENAIGVRVPEPALNEA